MSGEIIRQIIITGEDEYLIETECSNEWPAYTTWLFMTQKELDWHIKEAGSYRIDLWEGDSVTMTVRYFRVTFHHQDFTVTTCVNNLNMSTIDENTDVTTAHDFATISYTASEKLCVGRQPFGGLGAARDWLVKQAKTITIDEIKSDGKDWFTAEVSA